MNRPSPTTSRRSLLGAALAAPAVAVGAPLLSATPAAAVDVVEGCQVVVDWTPITPAPGVTPEAAAPPQARVIRMAGTEFLQLRGAVTCSFTADAQLGTLPPTIRPPKLTRGVCPRNNNLGINAVRVEANTQGVLTVFGPQTTNKVTWIQLDNFSSVLR
ncbi:MULTISPECIES: hypothetical protein [Streptomyces]|uniref:hypothetical protein n=1 Tax=Streptomyces TaxID=1883 RepID=UPI001318223B|nr:MULTISPECIES: hypothetical protein [Streptomyces]QGZ47251.1 hypothetical protein GPZ77_01445 [Streptomyces sp. QHH-9511]GGT80675.1 hypothetical protein GCM10010272_26480 [Streptomyces lateritius]